MSVLNHGRMPLRQMPLNLLESGPVSHLRLANLFLLSPAHFMVGSSVMAVTHCEMVSELRVAICR